MKPNSVQPPRIACWFVSLFVPAGLADSMLGDLLEEFSVLASKSGIAAARQWYWRQAVRTIAHFFTAAFRAAPWSTLAALLGGFLLLWFVRLWPLEDTIVWLLWQYADPIAIVAGGVFVRKCRSALRTPLTSS